MKKRLLNIIGWLGLFLALELACGIAPDPIDEVAAAQSETDLYTITKLPPFEKQAERPDYEEETNGRNFKGVPEQETERVEDSGSDDPDSGSADPEVPEEIGRQEIIDYAQAAYGVSEEWAIWLIGTTANEGYTEDRYLEYAWACCVINVYSGWSVWELDGIWGDYYSYGKAYASYLEADDTTLANVMEALVNTDTRISEVDGEAWYTDRELIYDSDIYNCQVWGASE